MNISGWEYININDKKNTNKNCFYSLVGTLPVNRLATITRRGCYRNAQAIRGL